MKFSYTISAEGNVNDEKIAAALNELGLKEIFVEKTPDAEAFIAEQSTKAEPELMQKWLKLCEREIIRQTVVQDRITSTLQKCKLLTRKIFAETIYNSCIELDLSELTAALTMCKVFENL